LSILTKVFVVLVTIVSVAVMALVVAFSANVENYKAKWTTEKDLRVAAEGNAEQWQEEFSRMLDYRREMELQHAEAMADLERQNTALKNELTTAQEQIQTLGVEKSTLVAQNSRLTALNAQLTAMKEGADTDLTKLRQTTTDQARQIVELTDRNAELSAEKNAQEAIARRLAERNTILEEEIHTKEVLLSKVPQDVMSEVLGQQTKIPDAPKWMDPPVYGKVVRVNEKGGEIYLELNVGTNEGVQENTLFMISRGETYLGDLVIESVDVNAAAGRIRNPAQAAKGGGIKVGDDASSGPGV